MRNNVHKSSIYHDTLARVLRSKILKEIDRRKHQEIKYHHHTLTGLVNTLTKIVSYSYTQPNYHIDGKARHLKGWHIYGSDVEEE